MNFLFFLNIEDIPLLPALNVVLSLILYGNFEFKKFKDAG